jgi:hypothetical protein
MGEIRKGTCQPDICQSACCKFVKTVDAQLKVVTGVWQDCPELAKDGQCIIHNSSLPDWCADFPRKSASKLYQKCVPLGCTLTFEEE